MATPKEVMGTWMVLTMAYPTYAKDAGEVALKQTAKIYVELLADIPGAILTAAAKQHIASSKWFPTVAELRDGANNLMLAALPERGGVEAWGVVVDTFTDGRYYQYDDGHATTPEFDDPLITQTVKAMGGYWHLYGCIRDKNGNPAADRARFIECYETLKRRRLEDTKLLPDVRAMREQIAAGGAVLQLPDASEIAPRGPERAAQIGGVVGGVTKRLTAAR